MVEVVARQAVPSVPFKGYQISDRANAATATVIRWWRGWGCFNMKSGYTGHPPRRWTYRLN